LGVLSPRLAGFLPPEKASPLLLSCLPFSPARSVQQRPRRNSRPYITTLSNRKKSNFLPLLNNTIMADLKRRTLQLSSGKQIKLFGNSVAISKTLEIGEGYAPNILSAIEAQPDNKIPAGISNSHRLTPDELMELADFNIQLWMDLKAGLRKYGQIDAKIFGQEAAKMPAPGEDKPGAGSKRKIAEKESQ
jgi:hypothetical protein